MADLTPVERGVLVALMAAGGPLREAADLGGKYGLKMTAWHRGRLADMGFVKTTKNPFTHELTEEGWAFLAKDFPRDVPQEKMKLGAMNALVESVRERLSARGESLQAFFADADDKAAAPAAPPEEKTTESVEAQLMADAAWSESETMLAMALQSIPAFGMRLGALEKSLGESDEAALKQLSLSADSVFQNIRMAARKRGLEPVYK
ncbi:MAG: hypothetical protein RLN72_05530, partial [Henriciella sp.]